MLVSNLAPRIGLAACLLAMFACGAEEDLVSETSAPIIGGHSAPHGDYGWFASLWEGNGIWADYRNCGGSLIASAWVLTAAHCVDAGVDYVEIGPTDATEREVIGIFVHPSMDIALLLLTPSTSAEPVALNVDPGFPAAVPVGTATFADANLTAAGFGFMVETGLPSDDLLEVDVPAVTNDSCDDVYDLPVGDTDICTGIALGGMAPCHGDSGGPLLAWTGAGQTLVGVTNWSVGCARALQPTVYGRVSSAAGWIADIVPGVRFVSPAALIGTASPVVI